MFYIPAEIERTIDNLWATSHSVEDAGLITAARHMREAADMLQSVLDTAADENFKVEGEN